MNERELEKRLRRLEKASGKQALRLDALTLAIERVLVRIERQLRHEAHEIEEIEERLKPRHYPATTGITVKPA